MKVRMNSIAKLSASRNGVLRNRLARRMQAVAGIADGVEKLGLERLVDLGPQAADMCFDDTGLRIEMEIPHPFQQHGAGDDAALSAHQHFQQAEFPLLKIDRLALPRDLPPDQVHLEIADLQDGFLVLHRRSSGQRVDARKKLGKGERLDEVVVAASLEAFDTVVDAADSGEKENRRPDPGGAHRL